MLSTFPSVHHTAHSAQDQNVNGRTASYWFKCPDDGRLMALPTTELRVCLVLMHAIQRDKRRGLISVRQIAARAQLKSPGTTQQAIAALCDAGWFSRHNPHTGAEMKRPAEWKSRLVEYRLKVQWKEKDPDNCSAQENTLPIKRTEGVELFCPGEHFTNKLFCPGEQHLEYLKQELRSPSLGLEGSVGGAAAEKPTTTPPREKPTPPDPDPASAAPEPAAALPAIPAPAPDMDPDEGAVHLRAARAAGTNTVCRQEDIEAAPLPDRLITARIVRLFRSRADFVAWLRDTVRRGIARKSGPGWGLYLADAGQWTAQHPQRIPAGSESPPGQAAAAGGAR